MLELLLRRYGISEEDRDYYLNPDYLKLHSPLLLPDMEIARDRVLSAIKNEEHIVVFSDYDADGIPGAVVLSDFFKRIAYTNVSFYIPHRNDEGFGLNSSAVNECVRRGATLIITVDCGTADREEIKLAKKKGIDVIVTDHHESNVLPEAFAIVNPKRKDSSYPFPYLCGSAIAFKLVQAILSKENFGVKLGMEKWSLDMVGIATLSDCVPLIGENRILAHFGLEVLRRSPRLGLASLFNRLKINQRYVTEDDVTFMITPRINAASRMGLPEDAFKLLSTDDPLEAERLAAHLEAINNERKGVVASIVKAAKKELEKRDNLHEAIVIGNPDWKPSLLGLVANSLVEEYARPVFVWGRDGDGKLKGSCRSYNGYDLYKLMDKAADSFLEFGGHKGAGGFSVSLESLSDLEERLSYELGSMKSEPEETKNPLVINFSEIGEELWRIVERFSPFGEGNEKPVFKIANTPIKSVRQFGKANEHLELVLESGIKAISFFSSPRNYGLVPDTPFCTLEANLEKSYFRSRPEIRLRIVDVRP